MQTRHGHVSVLLTNSGLAKHLSDEFTLLLMHGLTFTSSCFFCVHCRILVEPACGAGLSVIERWEDLGIEARLAQLGSKPGDGPILVIVCGGSSVNLRQLNLWEEAFEFGKESSGGRH